MAALLRELRWQCRVEIVEDRRWRLPRAGRSPLHEDTGMKVFTLPDLGEGLHEAEIVAWYVSVSTETSG